jgi:hypothetical protein
MKEAYLIKTNRGSLILSTLDHYRWRCMDRYAESKKTSWEDLYSRGARCVRVKVEEKKDADGNKSRRS